MSNIDCNQQLQAAAYLLGALRPEEAERYREHLQGCASCRKEIDELRPAASALPGTAEPVKATDALLGRVMVRVRSEADLLNAAGPQADRVLPTPTKWRSRRLAVLAAMATVAAGTAAGAVLVIASESSPSQRVTQALVAASTGGGRAELRQNGTRAELLVSDIPQPPAGKVYQVWLARSHGGPQPTDVLFSVTKDGSASVDVPGNLHGIQRLMVTAEPAGGSRQPTSPPIITATLKPS
jgi:anti-sigma-K factor RskA